MNVRKSICKQEQGNATRIIHLLKEKEKKRTEKHLECFEYEKHSSFDNNDDSFVCSAHVQSCVSTTNGIEEYKVMV